MTFLAIDLAAIVHAATFCPTVFDHSNLVALILDDGIRVIFAPGFILVDVLAHEGGHTLDLWLAQYPTRILDRVAAHIEHHATAGTVYVPEPGHVWTRMFFGLLSKEWFADRAFVDQHFGADVFRREQEFLGIHQQDSRLLAFLDHLIRLFERDAERLLDNDMFPRTCRIHHNLTVQIIGDADVNDIDLFVLQHLTIITVVICYAAFFRKFLRIVGTGNRHHFGVPHPAFERSIMQVAHEAGPHHTNSYCLVHGFLLIILFGVKETLKVWGLTELLPQGT